MAELAQSRRDGFPDVDGSDGTDNEGSDQDSITAKPHKRFVLQKNVTGKFNRPMLLKFLKSDTYAAIHQRAHKDCSAERKHPFDSATPVSDSEPSKENLRKQLKKSAKDDVHDTDEMLHSALTQWQKCSAKHDEIQEKTLEMAQHREDREEKHMADQTAIEWARLEQAERTIAIQERQQALQMIKDPDPLISEEGRWMLRDLAERKAAFTPS